jgi:hypothetical protein
MAVVISGTTIFVTGSIDFYVSFRTSGISLVIGSGTGGPYPVFGLKVVGATATEGVCNG